jgi:FkbM family methyltransferase
MTVVECGACCGYHALNLAKAVGSTGKIYCFEANPELVEVLERNLDANGFGQTTEIHNKGIWSDHSFLPFPLAEGRLGAVGFRSTKDIHGKGGIARWFKRVRNRSEWHDIRMIEVLPLDDILADKEVHLIRMDIEGAELQAVQGGQRTLRERDIPLILEWTPEYAVPHETEALYGLLKSLEYRVWRILESGLTEIHSAEEFHSKHLQQCRDGQRDVLCSKSPPEPSMMAT